MNVYHTIAVERARLHKQKIILAQRVIDKIVRDALIYKTETGEALVGFAIRVPGQLEPDIYVLDTIAPEFDVVRDDVVFVQGDEEQGEIFSWLFDNWELYRRLKWGPLATDDKWNVPLAHLGDWHKHPPGLVVPSGGDANTAYNRLLDEELNAPQLVVILATVWNRQSSEVDKEAPIIDRLLTGVTPAKPLVIPANEATAIRLDGWYISLNTKRFIGVDLQIVPDDTLPTLPIIGWHLDKTNRIRKEIQALWREGYFGRLELYDLVDTPPIEICLIVDKPQSKNVFIVITKADYPASAPTVRAVPTADVDPAAPDFFMTLWNKAMPLPQDVYPAWEWTADRLIVDLIKAIEAKLAEGTVAK